MQGVTLSGDHHSESTLEPNQPKPNKLQGIGLVCFLG